MCMNTIYKFDFCRIRCIAIVRCHYTEIVDHVFLSKYICQILTNNENITSITHLYILFYAHFLWWHRGKTISFGEKKCLHQCWVS
jgi:hypothetical protein